MSSAEKAGSTELTPLKERLRQLADRTADTLLSAHAVSINFDT